MLGGRPTLVVADRVAGRTGDAVLIDGGLVVRVGSAADMDDGRIAVERYSGATLVGGLGDAHMHPVAMTSSLTGLNLARCERFDDLADTVRLAATELDPAMALIGTRLNDDGLEERRLPTRLELDAMASDRPVVLYRYCGHIAVANTAALDVAGVTPSTADPIGGSFDRDENGHPNGILRETAVSIVGDSVGPLARSLQPEQILAGMAGLVAAGLTRIGAIVSTEGLCGVTNELDLLLEVADDLPLHVFALIHASDVDEFDRVAARISRAGRRLHFLGMKDFTDGSLGGHTAALRQPYHDWASETGTNRFDLDRIGPIAERSLAMGGSVALHAIGDAACEDVIRYFGELRHRGVDADQLRIEHAAVLLDDDVEALAETGAVASVQPAFLASETDWLGTRLGGRVEVTYRYRSMAAAGIRMGGGSDCPVEPPFPLAGLAVAQDRAGLVPDEALDAEQALQMFTSGVSAALREPIPLEPGSRADFTLLDTDPLTATPDQLRRASVLATWIDGESHPLQPMEWA